METSTIVVNGREYSVPSHSNAGKGTQGEVRKVYEIVDGIVRTDRAFALKTINNEQPVKYDNRETEALRTVESSFVCHFEDASKEQRIIIMNWVDGINLQKMEESVRFLDRGIPTLNAKWNVFQEHTIRSILCQALLGLYSIHSKGLMHRDIKPDNLLISANPNQSIRITICDLGCARLNDGKDLSVVGAGPFMAANTKVSGQNVYTERRDIFALGQTLFFAMFHYLEKEVPEQIGIDASQYTILEKDDDGEYECFAYSDELLEILARMLNENELPSAESLLKTSYLFDIAYATCEMIENPNEQMEWLARLNEWKGEVVPLQTVHVMEDEANDKVYLNTISEEISKSGTIYAGPTAVYTDTEEIRTAFQTIRFQ